MKFVTRLLFLIFVAALLAGGAALAWFASLRSEKQSNLSSTSSIFRTSTGDIEYLEAGTGPAVLVFHGAPGGYDQAMLIGSELVEAGFQVIAFSRPGYLRTPLVTGQTPEQQADAAAELVASLDLPNVALVGESYGAPATLEFARRYPEKTRALVLISGVTKALPPDKKNPPLPEVLNEALTGDIGAWWLVETAGREPEKALSWTFDLTQTGDDTTREGWIRSVKSNPAQLEWFRDLVATFHPLNPRESGIRNDLLQVRALPPFPFETLTIPTLFVHGARDKFLSLADIEAASKKTPNARLLVLENSGHLVQLGPDATKASQSIIEFLREFSGAQPAP